MGRTLALTISAPPKHATSEVASANVLPNRNRFQVTGVDAGSVPTQMIKLKPLGHLANPEFIRCSVSANGFPIDAEPPVAMNV